MMLQQDFSPILNRIWDPKQGAFERKYFTEARITLIWEEFSKDPADLFAQVVDTMIRKFKTTPTVEQFESVGREIRSRWRERDIAAERDRQRQNSQEVMNYSGLSDILLDEFEREGINGPTVKSFISLCGLRFVESRIEIAKQRRAAT